MTSLHITNGDGAVDLLKAAGIEGQYLPWRDILHLGPVPMTHSLEALSTIRAEYLASISFGEKEAVLADFQQRDELLCNANDFSEIVLWFEHDLYDQLQILQLLDWFSSRPDLCSKLHLINPGKHLGYHTPEDAAQLVQIKQAVTSEQLSLANRAWHAYRQSTPESWAALLQEETTTLPFLNLAIRQSLNELPDWQSGLSATETSILTLVNQGLNDKIGVFRHYCQHTEAQFHGDMSLFWLMERMQLDSPAVLLSTDKVLSLTSMGQAALAKTARWDRHYQVPQWLGGYCISEAKGFYWDDTRQLLLNG